MVWLPLPLLIARIIPPILITTNLVMDVGAEETGVKRMGGAIIIDPAAGEEVALLS